MTLVRFGLNQQVMPAPEVDHRITLEKDGLTTVGLCVEVADNPAQPGGLLLTVLVREDFVEGDQCWLVDVTGARFGATVQRTAHHSGDRELTLATLLPPDARWR